MIQNIIIGPTVYNYHSLYQNRFNLDTINLFDANMTCEEGTFCKIHGKNRCIHTDYDYTFCDILGKGTFYVDEVHFVCPRFFKQNEKKGGVTEVAQLVTGKYGTINSGAIKSVASARSLQTIINTMKKPVECEMKQVGKTAGKTVCIVVPIQ